MEIEADGGGRTPVFALRVPLAPPAADLASPSGHYPVTSNAASMPSARWGVPLGVAKRQTTA